MASQTKKIIFYSLILTLIFAACGSPAPQSAPAENLGEISDGESDETNAEEIAKTGNEQEPFVVKFGYIPTGAYGGVFVAIEKGYFAEQGIELEMQVFRTGAEMVVPLNLGQLDAGGGETGTGFFNGVNSGLELRVVLPLSAMRKDHGYVPLVVRKDLFDSGEVQTVADLAGKKIAVNTTRGMTEYMTSRALAQAGLTVDDVELVIIPFPDMLLALQNASVDAATLSYPLVVKATSPGENNEPPPGVILLKGEDVVGGHNQNAVVYFGKTLLDPENHDVAVRFTIAYLKGLRDLAAETWREDKAAVNAIMKWTNLPEKSVTAGVSPYFDPNGQLDIESLGDIQAYYVNRGYTEYTDLLEIDEFVEDTFLEDALKELGYIEP